MTERVDIDYNSTYISNDERAYHDDDVPTEHDGRSDTRTGFNPKESNNEEHWKRLQKHQQGFRHEGSSSNKHKVDIKRDIDVVCSSLGCSKYVKDRTHWISQRIGARETSPQASVEEHILAIITLVDNEDHTRLWRQSQEQVEGRERIRYTDEYKEVEKALNADPKIIRHMRKRIREHPEYMSPNA